MPARPFIKEATRSLTSTCCTLMTEHAMSAQPAAMLILALTAIVPRHAVACVPSMCMHVCMRVCVDALQAGHGGRPVGVRGGLLRRAPQSPAGLHAGGLVVGKGGLRRRAWASCTSPCQPGTMERAGTPSLWQLLGHSDFRASSRQHTNGAACVHACRRTATPAAGARRTCLAATRRRKHLRPRPAQAVLAARRAPAPPPPAAARCLRAHAQTHSRQWRWARAWRCVGSSWT